MSNFTTGEVAKACGVSVRTVQYYDSRGILVPSALTEGGRRLYSNEDLQKMKIICYLRELDLSIDSIAKLLKEENSGDVIALILEEQRLQLRAELEQKQSKLRRLEELQQFLNRSECFSVQSIGDVAHIMEHKRNMRKLHTTLLLAGIPMALAEWGTVLLWILLGIWWPFVIYSVAAIPFAIWISRYYFSRVTYLCPACHERFVPSLKQAFWASHTPTTRKLTCTKCGYRGYCVEIFRTEEQK